MNKSQPAHLPAPIHLGLGLGIMITLADCPGPEPEPPTLAEGIYAPLGEIRPNATDEQRETFARGLAVANGKLIVSTTTGDIHCFSPGGRNLKLAEHSQPPYPDNKKYADAASNILEASGLKRGFCLIAGGETGQLAYELAKRSETGFFLQGGGAAYLPQIARHFA